MPSFWNTKSMSHDCCVVDKTWQQVNRRWLDDCDWLITWILSPSFGSPIRGCSNC
jgi:hypothetical protein